MAQYDVGDLRSGAKVEVEGQPYTVVTNTFTKPGKGQAFNRVRLKHLMTSRVVEMTFKSGTRIDQADIADHVMRLLYKEADGAVFMDENL